MKRIQSRATLRHRSASPNLSERSTIPDLKVLHVHYARQRMHGEVYDEYECGESSPKRKRAIVGIRNANKTFRDMQPFVRPRYSYGCSYDERQPRWSPGVRGLVDPHIDIIMDYKMADVEDGSWFQSKATSGFSIGADSTFMKRVVHGDLGAFHMPERLSVSKKTTDPRPRPRPAPGDIDMTASQELPSASNHHPRRDVYEAGPDEGNFW